MNGGISSGGIGGSTGSTDNAVLRADGTGAATVQNSLATIDDNGKGTFLLRVNVIGTNGNYPTIIAGDLADNYIELTADADFGYLGTSSDLKPIKVRGSRTIIDSNKLCPSSGNLTIRTADNASFAPVQGLLTTSVNATTGLTAGVLAALTNATIVLYDASGQAYRVPCII